MVNKKAVIIVTIITIILVATIVGYFILKLYVPENTVEDDISTENNYSENSSSNSDKLENGEDVAINLAKKKYNKDDENVYYYVEEQIDHDVYVISVRNKSTTASIMQYEVNITTEEVTEY